MNSNIKLKIAVTTLTLLVYASFGASSDADSVSDSCQFLPANKYVAGFFPDDGVPKYKPKKKDKSKSVPAPPAPPTAQPKQPIENNVIEIIEPADNYRAVEAPPTPPGQPEIDTSSPQVTNQKDQRTNKGKNRNDEPAIRINPWNGLQYGHDFTNAPPVNPDRPLDAITDRTHDVLKANIGDPNDLKASPYR